MWFELGGGCSGEFRQVGGKGQRKKDIKKTDSHYKKSRLSKGIDGGLLVRARVQKYSEKLILSARLREVRRAKIAGGQDGEQLKKEIKKTDSRYKKRWSDRGSTGWI